MIQERILFQTEVGSYMWGMQKPDSDRDIMCVYAQPTREILSGMQTKYNKHQHKTMIDGIEWDTQYMEIGHLVNLLKNGNVNALWTVTSPVVIQGSDDLNRLREITLVNLSKVSFYSINGMAVSCLHDQEKRPNMPYNKAYKQCLRTLMFGINMFELGEVLFTPVRIEVTKNDIDIAFNRLNEAFNNTKLISSPNEQVFKDYLYNLRISNIV